MITLKGEWMDDSSTTSQYCNDLVKGKIRTYVIHYGNSSYNDTDDTIQLEIRKKINKEKIL
ncbi:hypothetical protein H8356DRAFT_1355644 [Neocallimastix lanati (nom. inval.)]|nr:hypothetical protein H8356DRAFT_1355644 [Neocallimastix sp. JGI-2020a]